MGETGLGIDFIDAFINEETEKSRELARKAAEEAAKKNGDNNDDDGDAVTDGGTDDKEPAVTTVPEGTKDGYYFRYPWSSPVYIKKG
jgi:hypothetical protein